MVIARGPRVLLHGRGLAVLVLLAFVAAVVRPAQGQTVALEGIVVGEGGQPLSQVPVSAAPSAGCCPEFFAVTQPDGTFRLDVPPALYVVTADPPAPRNPARVRVDARGGSVTGIVLQADATSRPFVPDAPPRARLIQMGPADSAGNATVTGDPGAVPGNGSVFLISVETGQVRVAQAAADGSFSGSAFAPPGSSVLVKADPQGVSFVGAPFNDRLIGETTNLSVLPGTILRVPDPPAVGPGVAFGGAGTRFAGTKESPLPAWRVEGSINSQRLQPGDALRARGTLRMTSPALVGAGPMQSGTRITLERLSAPDGQGVLARNSYASVFLTPTGLPIERMPLTSNPFDRGDVLPIPKVAPDSAAMAFDLSLTLPSDLLPGYYRPLVTFNLEVPEEFPPAGPVIHVDRANRRPANGVYLPVVRIGNPAPPRLYWTLLSDTLSNGSRGARAIEDRGRFGLASRILTQSETFIVPRVDPVSGQPITYRLEPFAPTIALGDQAPPNPPLIPFRFPSGSLTARITRPDGSQETLGPAPFVQDRMKSPADRRGALLDGGGGHITDLYQLSTMDPRFEVQFAQDGRHVVMLDGTIEDIWGNTWTGGGTYEVHVARTLSLDTAVLPMTPFEVGDVFSAGLVLSPPVPADVEVRFRLAPDSDASRMVERVVRGRANRFGHFHPVAAGILLDQPGEYRVDVAASYLDERGTLWMGARTWGSIIAPRNPAIIAHGRRGTDTQPSVGPQWFFRSDIGIAVSRDHVPFPFHSGDIMWLQKSDAAVPLVTVQDPTGTVASLLRARFWTPTPFATPQRRWRDARVAQGVASAIHTPSRFQVLDERMHKVTAPWGASTSWESATVTRGRGIRAARGRPPARRG